MHYKNKRECKVGDMVIGKTHNSSGKLRVGIVDKLMPDQGACNVRLTLLNSHNPLSSGVSFADSLVRHPDAEAPIIIATGVDYADVAELAHLEDCFKMHDAVLHFGAWNSPYLNAGGKLDQPMTKSID